MADRGLAQFRGLLAVSPLLGELFARIRNPDVLVGSDRPTVRRGVTEHYLTERVCATALSRRPPKGYHAMSRDESTTHPSDRAQGPGKSADGHQILLLGGGDVNDLAEVVDGLVQVDPPAADHSIKFVSMPLVLVKSGR